MNKFIRCLLSLIVVTGIAQNFLPWWILIPIGFVIGIWYQGSIFKSYCLGFLGIFLLWLIASSYFNYSNGGTMAPLLGNLFGNLSSIFSLLLTGVIGGVMGGLSVLSGALFRGLLK